MSEIIHKLAMPVPRQGYLNELILCWSEHGSPSPDQIRHTKFAININEVNCNECWDIWRG